MSDFISGIEEKYPSELLQGRLILEGNIVGSIFSDTTLLDDYEFNTSDFITKDGRTLFKIAKKLKEKKYNSFDEIAIETGLSEQERETLESIGGYDEISNITSVINLDNAEKYIDDLYKSNLLLKLHKDGFNLINPIAIEDKEIAPYRLFKNMTSEDVADFYEERICEYSTAKSTTILEDEMIDLNDDMIERITSGAELGTPFAVCGKDIDDNEINGFRFLSNNCGGVPRRYLSMISSYSNCGKSTFMVNMVMSLISQGEKVIIISNEEDNVKYTSKFLMWILIKHNRYYNINRNKLASNNLTAEDRRQINIAKEYFKENIKGKLKIVHINDSDISIARKKIREAKLKYGFTTFVYDTFKIAVSDMTNSRTDLALVRDTRTLSQLAAKYDMIGIASCQLAESTRGALFLSASQLSNSKQIKEVLSLHIMMRNCYAEELDEKSKYYIKPFRRVKKDDDKWVEEPFNVDKSAVYRIVFIEKTRNGETSTDNGVCYLMKFSGSQAVFREVALCKPTHHTIGIAK